VRCELVCSDDGSAYGIANLPALREMVFNSSCKAME